MSEKWIYNDGPRILYSEAKELAEEARADERERCYQKLNKRIALDPYHDSDELRRGLRLAAELIRYRPAQEPKPLEKLDAMTADWLTAKKTINALVDAVKGIQAWIAGQQT